MLNAVLFLSVLLFLLLQFSLRIVYAIPVLTLTYLFSFNRIKIFGIFQNTLRRFFEFIRLLSSFCNLLNRFSSHKFSSFCSNVSCFSLLQCFPPPGLTASVYTRILNLHRVIVNLIFLSYHVLYIFCVRPLAFFAIFVLKDTSVF